MRKRITSSKNDVMKHLRLLLQGRNKEGHFLLEGPVIIKESLTTHPPHEVVVSENREGDYEEILSAVQGRGGRVIVLDDRLFESLSKAQSPQGILGIYRRFVESTSEGRGLRLFLDGVQDPGNLGTIFRSAAAFGVREILLGEGCCDVYNPKVLRASASCILRIPFRQKVEPSWLWKKREEGTHIIALEAHGGRPLEEIDLLEDAILIVGNEAHGLSEETKKLVDTPATIPLEREVESLNAAVATSIALYALFQRGQKGKGL